MGMCDSNACACVLSDDIHTVTTQCDCALITTKTCLHIVELIDRSKNCCFPSILGLVSREEYDSGTFHFCCFPSWFCFSLFYVLGWPMAVLKKKKKCHKGGLS